MNDRLTIKPIDILLDNLGWTIEVRQALRDQYARFLDPETADALDRANREVMEARAAIINLLEEA